MARTALLAGNWKMHKTIDEAVDLVRKLRPAADARADRDVLVCPPFTALAAAAQAARGSRLAVGAQNMSDQLQGAYTGEVSAPMLKDAGATHVILGHSERRQLYGETDAFVNKKCLLALERGLTPIVCLGETLAERESGRASEVVERQAAGSLAGLGGRAADVIVAYEPVWAIGTGKTASPDQAQEMHAFIRAWVVKAYGDGTAARVRILYGGSIKPDNVDALMARPDIDGGLVGGASLKAEDFLRLVEFREPAEA